MNTYLRMLALVLGVAATDTFAASPHALLTAGAQDQVPATLVAAPAAISTLERAPVRFSHALDSAQPLATAKPFVAQSREFWITVDEAGLRAGVRLTTTAPAALLRISPHDGSAAALDPAEIVIRRAGRTFTARAASTAVADESALRQAGMDAPAGTLAFRLAPEVGSGEMEIAAPRAQGRYLIHVFEPDSSLTLEFGADRDTVLVGSSLTFRATLVGSANAVASGLVTAPDGYSADLHFAHHPDGSFSAAFTPDAAHAIGPQLWEAHVFASVRSGGANVLRDAKTAFAVSTPIARLDGSLTSTRDAAGLHLAIGVEAATASRYQISGVLYASDDAGILHATALAQSAAWHEPGKGAIQLQFDTDVLGAALHAPYELRDLRLVDQAGMSLLERRERAATVD